MTKTLRLQQQGANILRAWDSSAKYSTNAINQIDDPNGASAEKPITSIPSPFAQMDLVKTSFEEASKNLDGNTIYNKIVSDSLDVAQIFFEYENLKEYFNIIAWDPAGNLQTLLSSNNPSHVQLGKTLKLYLTQDGDNYNFNKMHRIYLLDYKGPDGPAQMNIVGATSPASLFFASANDLSYVSKHVTFGQDKPFDKEYMPLYKRDFEFVKYLWVLKASFSNFAELFSEFNHYLDENFKNLTDEQKTIIRNIDSQSSSKYDVISMAAANSVEILGNPIYKRPVINTVSSDFMIKSSVYSGDKKPLVLPVEKGNDYAKWYYVNSEWGTANSAPYSDNDAWQKRSLPCANWKYPYLTIGDFLNDTIIKMPYKMNSQFYFDGNLTFETAEDVSYLMPLSDLFFQFFTTEELSGVNNGRKMIEMNAFNGEVSVILRIPTVKGIVEYRKKYVAKNAFDKKDGIVKEYDFAYASFPVVSFRQDNDAHYRMGISSEFNSCALNLDFYKQNTLLKSEKRMRNKDDNRYKKSTIFALDGTNYTHVKLSADNDSGMIIPLFKQQYGNDQFTFAIDFGTTNTHIEYSVNGSPSKPVEICKEDVQLQYLAAENEYELAYKNAFNVNLMPQMIGEGCDCKFPMRTVLTEGKQTTDWRSAVYSMADVNPSFTYEKLVEHNYNRNITNLKWSTEEDTAKEIKAYISSLFFLLRNKVILNGGDLASTKIVWFYPVSMTRAKLNHFRDAWNGAYSDFFGDNAKSNLKCITESVAPFEYFRSSYGSANILTIDIGGGTSDVVMASNSKVNNITSFRFAANSIFGNAYADVAGAKLNGVVNHFKDSMVSVLETNSVNDLISVYRDLVQKNNSADIASFFFSLCQNKTIVDKKIANNVDFNAILGLDDNFKIVFLLFYSAIIYHVANIMKFKNMDMPRYLTFSGNGSKVISILTNDEKLLAKYTKLIFSKVYGRDYSSDDLSIVMPGGNPKEATCKGGIFAQEDVDIDDKKLVMNTLGDFVGNRKYGSIGRSDISNIVNDVREFLDFVFSLNNDFNFGKNFGIENKSFELAKSVCYKDLEDFTKNGLNAKKKEVCDDDEIEETMFFYPLTGMLNSLAEALYDLNNNQIG